MKELAILCRAMQLFYHNCHNLCARVPFFTDHEAFAEFYSTLESTYDSVIERMLGLDVVIDLVVIQELAVAKLKSLSHPVDNAGMFLIGLNLEKEMCSIVEKLCSGQASQGVKNLLAGEADKSEVRQYKLKQRIKK